MADEHDPFDADLRAGLDSLRARPERAAVERGLGVVQRLGRRRRQRRRVAGGAVALVAAVLVVAASMSGVDSAADQQVRLGGPAGGPGTAVAGSRPVPTTPTTGPAEPPDGHTVSTSGAGADGRDPADHDRGGEGPPPSSAAASAGRPEGPAVTTTVSPAPPGGVTSTTWPPPWAEPAPGACYFGTQIDGVVQMKPNYETTCLFLRRSPTLRLQLSAYPPVPVGTDYMDLVWPEGSALAGQTLVRVQGRDPVVAGAMDDILPVGRWVRFEVWYEYVGQPRAYREDLLLQGV